MISPRSRWLPSSDRGGDSCCCEADIATGDECGVIGGGGGSFTIGIGGVTIRGMEPIAAADEDYTSRAGLDR